MEIEFFPGKIIFNKPLSRFDHFVVNFADLLQEHGVRYVIVSGYVAIFFGRSRTSEDVDFIIEKLDFERFQRLWAAIEKNYECLNTLSPVEAYEEYLMNNTAIRFAEKGKFVPNVEFKFPKNELDTRTLDLRLEVKCCGHTQFFSPLEQQVAYKLFLGSEKDIEDARFIYQLTKDHLDKAVLERHLDELGVPEELSQAFLGES